MLKRALIAYLALLAGVAGLYAAAPGPSPLDGTWEITQLIDNGVPITTNLLRSRFVLDGQFIIAGNTISLVRPDGWPKKVAFVTAASASPRAIDLAGTEVVGAKGIYMVDGDNLLLCLAGPESNTRPRTFASQPGSNTILMTLQRRRDVLVPVSRTTVVETPPPPPPPPAPVATPAKSQAEIDADNRRTLLGTWGHQDDDKIDLITFNQDGSYSHNRTWKRGFKKMFNDPIRSSGSWRVKDGVIIMTVTASTDRDLQGQVFSYRIRSISPTEILYVDQDGRLRREWKTLR